jgi:hypothetical protein
MVLAIGLGLLLRSGGTPFPSAVVKYGGVALWAVVVFLGLGFILARTATITIACAAVCISWGVEFLQLYHAPWIDVIRSTRLGLLVLGSTFHSPDLMAYCLGVAFGAIAEAVFSRK